MEIALATLLDYLFFSPYTPDTKSISAHLPQSIN